MEGLQLISTGGALPSRVVTNEDLSKLVDTSDEWITTRTGIRQRRFCGEGQTTATLAIEAAKQALERSGLQAEQIGCCVCATLSGAYATPSTACLVQHELGLAEDIPVLDVNAACSGFIYGAAVARGLLAARPQDSRRFALVIGCEQLSRLMDMTDRNTCVLFGDGAGAAIFALAEDSDFAVDLGARGDMAIETPPNGPIHMDGRAVFRFAVDALPRTLHAVLEATHHTLDEVDWVVCHQANSRIIDNCVKKMQADPEKFYKNMDRHGNTSAASIPVALNELAEDGRLQPGMRIACIGFGGGLTWGGMLLTVKGSVV
ncbi:beta-ketoacyl-ACP synthase III [uncultured Subdoligranulum sp.]|uniref:beta-ketoacyl-ACP synthase III n=1 Tax=uncultured Subdoligranulum sp. TaxID=512298 RepID=UPI00262066F0|nr:beta-ketoacyl-ACP synthase III [uncultured Subdoligranulum sp.]